MCLTAACQIQAAILEAALKKWTPVGQAELASWRETPAGDKSIILGKHGVGRKQIRQYASFEIISAILKGRVIERRLVKRSSAEAAQTKLPPVEVKLLVAHSFPQTRDGKQVTRHIHVAVVFVPGSRHWTITTVYDPEDDADRWSENYTRRICWCHSKQNSGGKEVK